MTAPTAEARTGVVARAAGGLRTFTAGLPSSVLVVYLVATTLGLLSFAQGDIHWTVNASYSYLTGHITDFYDYNLATVGGADYFPTVYVIFAVWMAPVKWLLGTDAQPGGVVSPMETAWAKLLLVLVFWATAWLVARIARELFTEERARQVARFAYLLSPFAAFAVVIFGQYDVFGVFFSLLGFLYLLKGDKWRFALFFALAASCKYFALIIFVPLVLLAFKRFRDLVALSAVAVSVLVLEALLYLGSPAFRSRTLLGGLASDKVSGAGQNQITLLLAVLFAVGCWVLWRSRPTPERFGEIAVHACALAYGFMLLAVVWNPQWFMILTPFYAFSAAYLRRPVRFLLWESVAFVAFVWYVVNRSPANVDATMILNGSWRDLLGAPRVLLGAVYPASAMTLTQLVLIAFLISPAIFALLERLTPTSPAAGPVPGGIWMVRALTPLLAFTLPSLALTVLPMRVAERLDPGAGTYGLTAAPMCGGFGQPYGELHDGAVVRQTFTTTGGELDALSVQVGTYARPVTGTITTTLADASGTVLATSSTDLSSVTDNGQVYLRLPGTTTLVEGAWYTLTVSTTGVAPGAGVALWGSLEDCQAGVLTLADADQPGDLAMVLYRPRP